MKNLLAILSFLFCTLACQANTDIIYVKAGATGNGSSWTNAIGNLQTAISMATTGTQIWVATGTYKPTKKADRNASFTLTNDIELYGGFIGNETDLSQRNWQNFPTVLSGEIGTSALNDNAYTVVRFKNASETTVIDGFVIERGFANGKNAKSAQRCGGGIFNDATNGTSNPTINNCTFRNNHAREGAGIYNNAKNGTCKPNIVNCTFKNNKADLDGGAIYNNGEGGQANPFIKECTFVRNEATYGGAILNQGTYQGESSPIISDCIFDNNISYLRGGSFYNNERGGECNPQIIGCDFRNNKAPLGKENQIKITNNKPRSSSSITRK